MFRANLFVKAFSTIVVGVLLLSGAYYLFSVPLINDMAFEIEERAGRTYLDHTYEIIRRSHSDLLNWKETAIGAHKREMRNIVRVAAGFIRAVQVDISAGRLSLAEGQQIVLDKLRAFKYGNNDYVWVNNYDSIMISHPDPKVNGADFSQVVDVKGNLVIPPMVDGARRLGEGFHSYWWRRLGDEKPVEKLTHYQDVPEWGWVICTGVYIDDIDEEVALRKQQLVGELRRHLNTVRLAGSGYVFVFDAASRMIIHPNPSLEGSNFGDLTEPGSGRSLAGLLTEAAHRRDSKTEYTWDKPTDSGHYVYDKVSWVRHFDGFDWYIGSSVYKEDLKRSAEALTRRILLVTAVGLMLAIIGGYLFVDTFTSPIKRLAERAQRIALGDLSGTEVVARRDEIGLLGTAFNTMVEQLRDQIRHLEARVVERTSELSDGMRRLESRNREIQTLYAMGDMLQSCRTAEETYGVVSKTAQDLFPHSSGGIFVLNRERHILEPAMLWGSIGPAEAAPVLSPDDCWAVRRGRTHFIEAADRGQICRHVGDVAIGTLLCVPMAAYGEVLGALHIHLAVPAGEAMAIDADRQRLAETIAEQTALALANQRLRHSLHMQSIRDPLTGLFNRRHLDDVLNREERRAAAHGIPVGVLMIDVDHFKRVNDTFGHEAGDAVLRTLGTVLTQAFRDEDVVCRLGGEEFTVVMPSAGLQACVRRAEVLRHRIEEQVRVPWQGQDIRFTISVGAAEHRGGDGRSMLETLAAADAALYRAKGAGRNRVAADTTADTSAEEAVPAG